tara:strand:- start:1169 stop:1375 length:207 start_codon:yes stop_codon:yes gene_type:complete
MTTEIINDKAKALEVDVPAKTAEYVKAVFEQTNFNQNEWGSTNAQVIAQLQARVRQLEIEVANLKGRL